jgi:hypothetical protein
MKAFAGREQDWGDVKGIIARQGKMDWKLIYSELEPLCELKEAPDIVVRLKALQKELKAK